MKVRQETPAEAMTGIALECVRRLKDQTPELLSDLHVVETALFEYLAKVSPQDKEE